jgi:L-fuculose-phosphate aldolase
LTFESADAFSSQQLSQRVKRILQAPPYMDEAQARQALCEIGRRVWQREYIASNDGNFSVRVADNRILCTPTMVSKGFMHPDELPVVDLDGKHIAGPKRPTSEIRMHLAIYRVRQDVGAVVHVHPPHATAFAVVRRTLPKCVLPEVEIFLGEIPLVPYATPGTQEFAESAVPFARQYNAFLLTNHGAVTVGQDPFEAYYRMETVEQYCRILILAASLGTLQSLDTCAMADLLRLREKLGYKDRRLALPPEQWCTPETPSAVTGSGAVKCSASDTTSHQAVPARGASEELVAEIVRRVIDRLAH